MRKQKTQKLNSYSNPANSRVYEVFIINNNLKPIQPGRRLLPKHTTTQRQHTSDLNKMGQILVVELLIALTTDIACFCFHLFYPAHTHTHNTYYTNWTPLVFILSAPFFITFQFMPHAVGLSYALSCKPSFTVLRIGSLFCCI